MNTPDCITTDSDILAGYAEDGSGEVMTPDLLARPSSTEETVEVVRYCNEKGLPITPSGARTCDTAAALNPGGLCLASEQMKRIVEINEDELYAIVEPGILLGDLKRELLEKDLFYPPDPTSENIATLGGTVATNASGARSYKYGATNRYILGLEAVLPSGELAQIDSVNTTKITTGPASFSRLSDLWVGSEGIFGVFTKLKLRLFRGVPKAFAIVAFFESLESLISFVQKVDSGPKTGAFSPRALEYMDSNCLRLLRESGKFPQVPHSGRAALIIEQEYQDEYLEESLEKWLEALEKGSALLDDCIVADTPSKITELRELRHYVPSHVWEMGKEAASEGGRKVSTDWAVPLTRFVEMSDKAEVLCAEFGFPEEKTFRYAHIGDGHPHYNFVPKNRDELKRCLELRVALSKLAVSLGGTVAGEHGIGKHRKNLLALENPSLKIRLMKALKQELDPKNIMAPGNLF